MDITLPELEQAINHWRTLRPSTGEECALSPEVNALATVYATMIFYGLQTIPLNDVGNGARQLLEAWKKQQG